MAAFLAGFLLGLFVRGVFVGDDPEPEPEESHGHLWKTPFRRCEERLHYEPSQ